MSLLAANGGTVTTISVEIFKLTLVTNSGFTENVVLDINCFVDMMGISFYTLPAS